MLQVIKIVNQPMDVNTYVLFEEDVDRALVIDPSFEAKRVDNVLREEGLKLEAILLTHGHFDHIAGVEYLRSRWSAPVYMHEKDAAMLMDADKNFSRSLWGEEISAKQAEHLWKKDQIAELAGMKVGVMSTPGHSQGSVCYLVDSAMFSGDMLFFMGVGRTDFPGSSDEEMRASIERLSKIEEDYEVYPGHGQSTSLVHEQNNNPYFRMQEWSV